MPDVREEVADHGRDHDRDAAHRRRAGLGDVRVLDRAVVADLLADAPHAQPADQERREEERHEERRAAGHEHRDHDATPEQVARRPTSSPTARLAFTSTVSPARDDARATARSASPASAAVRTSGDAAAPRPAMMCAAVPDPDEHVDTELARRARPTQRVGVVVCAPSSRMSPSTAMRRPVVAAAREREQRGVHRRGVRVVRVVQHAHAVGADVQLQPPARRARPVELAGRRARAPCRRRGARRRARARRSAPGARRAAAP